MNQLVGTQDKQSAADEKGEIPQRLLDLLQDGDPQARRAAIDDLADYAPAPVAARLSALARDDPDPEVRQGALEALGALLYTAGVSAYDPEADRDVLWAGQGLTREDVLCVYEALLAIYRAPGRTPEDRRGAVETLSFFSNETVESAIDALYQQPERASKISALVSMGRNGAARWLPIIRKDLYHPDRDLQRLAVRVAGEFGEDALGQELLHLTYAGDRRLMLAALWALGQTGWEGAFDRLDECTMSLDPEIRQVADEAMDEWLFYNGLDSGGDEDEPIELDDLFDPE
jgi:HEAT repeat protein